MGTGTLRRHRVAVVIPPRPSVQRDNDVVLVTKSPKRTAPVEYKKNIVKKSE